MTEIGVFDTGTAVKSGMSEEIAKCRKKDGGNSAPQKRGNVMWPSRGVEVPRV